MKHHRWEQFILAAVLFAPCAWSQGAASAQPAISNVQLDLTNFKALAGLPNTGAYVYPFTCSSDGQIYVAAFAFDQQGKPISTVPDLFRISQLGDVKHIERQLPTEYKQVDTPSFFATENALVTLIRAAEPNHSNEPPKPGTQFFLSITDRDGDNPTLISLKLDFDPVKLSMFQSGEFIVLGADRKTHKPVLALLSKDGEFRKALDALSEPVEKSSKSDMNSDQAENERRQLFFSIGAAQFAAWGSDILMAVPGIDTQSIYRFRPSGQVDRFKLRLPEAQQVAGVVGAGPRDSWVILVRTDDAAKAMAKAHVVENPEEYLYEVNPRTAEILRRIDVKGPQPGEVACAADGKLSAIYVDPIAQPGGSESLVLASTPR